MQSLEVKVQNIEEDIKIINEDLRSLKHDMSAQDEKIELKIDKKFTEIENKIDRNNDSQNTKSDRIAEGIGTIKDSLHSQEKASLELNYIVKGLLRDSDTNKAERNKMKWGIYGVGFTLAGSLILTWLRIVFGF